MACVGGRASPTLAMAAKGGLINMLKKLHKEHGTTWDKYTLLCAARYNNAECFVYALENGCPLTD